MISSVKKTNLLTKSAKGEHTRAKSLFFQLRYVNANRWIRGYDTADKGKLSIRKLI